MLTRFENHLPRRLRFGRGLSAELVQELQRLEKSRPFIVTDRGVKAAGLLARVTAPLEAAGIRYTVYDQTEPEPHFACVTGRLFQRIFWIPVL